MGHHPQARPWVPLESGAGLTRTAIRKFMSPSDCKLLWAQVYSIEDSPLCLTGTAEVPLAGLHMDEILPAAALPLRMAAFGRAFRTEAGAAGSASRGLYRLHQFSKVGTHDYTAI